MLENLSRQVLAYDTAGERPELLLDGWEAHSRRIVGDRPDRLRRRCRLARHHGRRARPGLGPAAAEVRLGEPPTRLTILLERAASTLALGRLIRRDAEGLERQMHRTLLTALLDHTMPVDEVALRARALGVSAGAAAPGRCRGAVPDLVDAACGRAGVRRPPIGRGDPGAAARPGRGGQRRAARDVAAWAWPARWTTTPSAR